MTAPYSTELLELITGDLKHTAAVTVHPLTGDPYELDLENGSLSVTFSEDWAPYVQTNIGAAVPTLQSELDRLDPRQACRIGIDVGYEFPDGSSEIFPLADLMLRTRDVKRPSSMVDLTAASNEAMTQDYTWRSDFPLMPTTGINEAVSWCLEYSSIPFGYNLSSSFPAGAYASYLTELAIGWGDSMWRMLDEIASRTGRRIFCDEFGLWRIRYRATTTGTSQISLTVGENGTLLDTTTSLTREDWYNEVVVLHEWRDSAGVDQRAFGSASVTSGPFRTGAVGWKSTVLKSDRPISFDTAKAMAVTKLENLVTRGRSLRLTAIAAYWLRPGHTITVQLPTGEPELYLIQSITFHPLSGLMDITTRQPLDVTITTGD